MFDSQRASTYPFLSKNQIKEKLASDSEFVLAMFWVMQERHVNRRNSRTTVKRGWMSSHIKKASGMAAKLAGLKSTDINPDIMSGIRALVGRYTKQLAQHLRNEQIRQSETVEK